MIIEDRWLLPEGIEEVLPPAARRLERLRRDLLDLYDSWGYELVIPPFIEFLESLLTGTGNDLDLQTFKLTDQLSGRMMGVRADMTPQVARIDAHRLRHDGPTRFCYLGSVLRTRSDSLAGSRSPLQVGAELYGHVGYESDLEVLLLMLETLHRAGIVDVYLDLGHVAVFRSLVRQAGLDREREGMLFEALQRKALPEIREWLTAYALSQIMRDRFLALVELNGGGEVLEAAKQLLGADDEVQQALNTLEQLTAAIQRRIPKLPIHIDLAELRGYRYHTGVVFAAYTPGQGQAVAQGGRYDEIGQVFGRSRPATGFSADLRILLSLSAAGDDTSPKAIYAPRTDDSALDALVRALRSRGERVIYALPASDPQPEALGCDRILVMQGNNWVVAPLDVSPLKKT